MFYLLVVSFIFNFNVNLKLSGTEEGPPFVAETFAFLMFMSFTT